MDGVVVPAAVLAVPDGLSVTGAFEVGELVATAELTEGAPVGEVSVGSAMVDVQPASSSAAVAASAAIVALGTFVRVATQPSRGEEPRQLGTEGNRFTTLG